MVCKKRRKKKKEKKIFPHGEVLLKHTAVRNPVLNSSHLWPRTNWVKLKEKKKNPSKQKVKHADRNSYSTTEYRYKPLKKYDRNVEK